MGRVLVIGCSENSAVNGLKADAKAIEAQEIAVRTVCTGSVVRDGEHVMVTPSDTTLLFSQINETFKNVDYDVVKTGALLSEEVIQTVSRLFHQTGVKSVMDAEPLFKTGSSPTQQMLTALIERVLPSTPILSATVPEAKALLDAAKVPIDYPTSMQGVARMGNALRSLGSEFVIIKREIIEEEKGTMLLHYVLCGSDEPLMVTSQFENPNGMFGASYSIPPVIAAQLAKGLNVPKAVSVGFKFVEEMVKDGKYFV